MRRPADKQRLASRKRDVARNTQKYIRKQLRTPAAPEPPVVADNLLTGGRIGFLQFLADSASERFCRVLFGDAGTSAGTMLEELRKATEFHYYGLNPGKLTESKAATKRLLKKYARLAYRGDPDKRGVAFWERVAWLVWTSYDALMKLRTRAEKIKQREIERIGR